MLYIRGANTHICECVWRGITRRVTDRIRDMLRDIQNGSMRPRRRAGGWSYPEVEWCIDVRKLARLCLPPMQRTIFEMAYIDRIESPEVMRAVKSTKAEGYWHQCYAMERVLGRRLTEKALYPLAKYLAPHESEPHRAKRANVIEFPGPLRAPVRRPMRIAA